MLEGTEPLLREAVDFDPANKAAQIELGRVARQNGDHAAALRAFQRAMHAGGGDTALMEDIGIEMLAVGRSDEAAEILGALLSKPDTLAKGARSRISMRYASALVRSNKDDDAEVAFRELLASEPAHSGAIANLANLARRRGDDVSAFALFQQALEISPGNVAWRESLGHAAWRLNKLAEAAAAFETVLRDAPNNPRVVSALARVHNSRGDNDAAIAMLRAAPPRVETMIALAKMLHAQGSLAEAEEKLAAVLLLEPTNTWALHQLGAIARAKADNEQALVWFTRAAATAPDDPLRAFEVAATLEELGRLEEASKLRSQISRMPGAAASVELKLLRLVDHCRKMQFEAAINCLEEFDPGRPLPPRAVSFAMQLRAARSEWDEVLRLLGACVAPSTGGNLVRADELLVEAIARAARARGRQAEAIALLAQWEEAASPLVANLRDQLTEELHWLHALRPDTPAPSIALENGPRAERVSNIKALLGPRNGAPAGTLYLCSDRNYLVGAMVALSSALRNNRPELRNWRKCVFLSEDAEPLAAPMIDALAKAHGLPIEAVPVSRLGRAHAGYRIDWGHFTPGRRLSDAAYYRILAALWLLDTGERGRALYLDSDVCVGPGLAEVLRFDLGGKPLGARTEEVGQLAVSRAARRLGIPRETYFNSGVMTLDLGHDLAASSLLKSLEIAADRPEILSLHDQCALNLAFVGQTSALPSGFNLFVRMHSDLTTLPSGPPIVHYLDRPKPWDPAYVGANNSRWLREFNALGDALDPGQMRALVALSIGAAP